MCILVIRYRLFECHASSMPRAIRAFALSVDTHGKQYLYKNRRQAKHTQRSSELPQCGIQDDPTSCYTCPTEGSRLQARI